MPLGSGSKRPKFSGKTGRPKPPDPRPRARYPDKTTAWFSRSTLEEMRKAMRSGEDYDSFVQRVLSGQGEVWVDILNVDGDSPAKHSVLLKLGNFCYQWDGERFSEVDPRKVATVVKR